MHSAAPNRVTEWSTAVRNQTRKKEASAAALDAGALKPATADDQIRIRPDRVGRVTKKCGPTLAGREPTTVGPHLDRRRVRVSHQARAATADLRTHAARPTHPSTAANGGSIHARSAD